MPTRSELPQTSTRALGTGIGLNPASKILNLIKRHGDGRYGVGVDQQIHAPQGATSDLAARPNNAKAAPHLHSCAAAISLPVVANRKQCTVDPGCRQTLSPTSIRSRATESDLLDAWATT